MSTTIVARHDYTTGVPRHHHSLYLEDGNFVIQVENAIFKVHRSIIGRYSNVIKCMLEAPQGAYIREGTDLTPLVLTGDSVVGWELLLGAQYDSPSFLDPDAIKGARALAILPIAHKYCMDGIEKAIIKQLESVSNTEGHVNLMLAAQIIGSNRLYQQALGRVAASDEKIDITQAKRIGVESLHAIMTATISNLIGAHKMALASIQTRRCQRCRKVDESNWRCVSCGKCHYCSSHATWDKHV